MSFNESTVEEAAPSWFEELGYGIAHGPNIAPGELGAMRTSFDQVVLVERLREAIDRINPDIPHEGREEALREVLRPESPLLVANNRTFHRMLRDGVEVEYHRKDGSIAGDRVQLINYGDPNNNDWLAVTARPPRGGDQDGTRTGGNVVCGLNDVGTLHIGERLERRQSRSRFSEAEPEMAIVAPSAQPLSEHNPLASLTIPGLGEIKPDGLVLVVGPNSSGKTQLLQDIHLRLLGESRPFVVCQNVQLRKPAQFRDFLATLLEEGYLRERVEANGDKVLQTRTTHFGTGQPVNDKIRYVDAENAYNNVSLDTPGTRPNSDVRFLAHFGRMLSTVLFLANRLVAPNTTQHFDYENAHPSNDVQALYMNWAARDELTTEIARVFRRGIWLDNTRGNQLCFRISENPVIPCAEDRLRPDKMTQYRMVETEGDGFRSYVATCMALLLSRRPICLLDEPELCLHPPQAHAIGQFIGRHATKNNSTTFVATHSSHVLRGVIEATDRLKIIRMTRTAGKFCGHLVDYGILKECLQKPIVRTETIFDGIFANAVTIVEADGDRAVYDAVRESMPKDSNLDMLFIPVGGTGGIADTAALYRALRIPVAVMADLDLIMDQDKLYHIMAVLGGASGAVGIRDQSQVVATKIKAIPPTMKEAEVQSRLLEWGQLPCDWARNDDHTMMWQLRRLAHDIDRMRRLKSGGVGSFDGYSDIQKGLEQIIAECQEAGLFLVPVGELEYWAEDLMVGGPSKHRKSRVGD